ncbi:hypothetical protein BJ085DRAFT_32653 [Dimargaris cristalligena]|uniref:Dpy-30 motif-domain-containing protein n=1 Tax=Dimargaris cristalligena TaxID=215637 RepID=A0A4P9ZQN8_9FUNG|nr:hypothetical protein BJ085DRAFT_32653 [Dimargaris cristalligena]|eukprot:RKP34730.1 hypothetical protein BJ085DRAFT_32653 [Dimargaris cristalligena]
MSNAETKPTSFHMEVDDAKTDVTEPCPTDWDTTGILEANRSFFAEKPIQVYLEETVVPVLQAGLKQLALQRPADPCAFLGNFLLQHRTPSIPIKQEPKEQSQDPTSPNNTARTAAPIESPHPPQ